MRELFDFFRGFESRVNHPSNQVGKGDLQV